MGDGDGEGTGPLLSRCATKLSRVGGRSPVSQSQGRGDEATMRDSRPLQRVGHILLASSSSKLCSTCGACRRPSAYQQLAL